MRQKKMGRRERLGEIGSKRQEENRRGKCQVRERGREREEDQKEGLEMMGKKQNRNRGIQTERDTIARSMDGRVREKDRGIETQR